MNNPSEDFNFAKHKVQEISWNHFKKKKNLETTDYYLLLYES